MAIKNNKGRFISYDCSILIEDLENDLASGFHGNVIAYFVWREGVKIYQDYDLVVDAVSESLTQNIVKDSSGYDVLRINDFIGILNKANSIID